MVKYVALAIAALSLAACQSTAPSQSAAAGGTAATHNVRVAFDNGVEKDVATDYNFRGGDRVIMLSNGKVGPL
jgi:hypothetical protein